MTLQNRVDPFGVLHAVVARGTMMGNRGGRFHRPDRTLGRRRWSSRRWICCELDFKGKHHEAMGEGYTSLFFLDEVTALAAGHRPCFFCRRADARAFLSGEAAAAFDQRLHLERLAPRCEVPVAGLPEGAMIAIDGQAVAVGRRGLLDWSFTGYAPRRASGVPKCAKLLTPPAILSILTDGYKPRWHESALDEDGT